MVSNRKSCNCDDCQGACRLRPGWFKPDQIKKLFAYFNIVDIRGLFKLGFVIDWWNGDYDDILILAPQY